MCPHTSSASRVPNHTSEYINVLSGTFSLSIIGIPGLATHPGLNRQLYQALTPKVSIVRDEKPIPLHPKKKSMDLFAFADSPYAWLIEHACGALIKPTDVSSRRSRYVASWLRSKSAPNYILSFKDGVEIQPFYDLCPRSLSNESERLEITRKELAYWKNGQLVEEDSRLLSTTDKSLNDRQRRWILTFMKKFDCARLKWLMTDSSRRAASENQALIYQALVGICLLVSRNMR
jgi:hypothetical protein